MRWASELSAFWLIESENSPCYVMSIYSKICILIFMIFSYKIRLFVLCEIVLKWKSHKLFSYFVQATFLLHSYRIRSAFTTFPMFISIWIVNISISIAKTVTLLAGSGTTGFICVLCDIPIIQVIAFIILMCSGMAANIVNTAIVDLYPTSLR